ncbi:MAG TPA: hypothetical protein VJ934_11905 [Desulfomicrobiaceae bacterium]|nr:hypothetical protein [Desulfomicrobiaceae bacterium]
MKHVLHRCLIAVCLLLFVGCAPKSGTVTPISQKASLAVAGFSQPQHDWEMLAGFLPERFAPLPGEVLDDLDAELTDQLKERIELPFYGPPLTRQCREVVLAEEERFRVSALEYWRKVGSCMAVDYLLVPFAFTWEERQGGEWGVETPASVTFDLYLITVGDGTVKRFHFEERQQALTENILDADKFFRRAGKWVSARELAKDGIRQALEDLGL